MPAAYDSDTAVPADTLAANFAQAPRRQLDMSTRARVFGAPASTAWEPAALPDGLRQSVTTRQGCCAYCHLPTSTLEIDSVNDIHEDIDETNIVAADPLCHAYHHLGELGEGNARMVYLPGIDRTDLNHVQRLLAIDLYEGDEDQRKLANDLLNWLASHCTYAEEGFGTSEPSAFANVLATVKPEYREARTFAFEGIAVAFNPRLFVKHVSTWAAEVFVTSPRHAWAALAGRVMRLAP